MSRIKEHIRKNKWLLLVYMCISVIVAIAAFVFYEDSLAPAMNEPRSVMTVQTGIGVWKYPDQSVPLTEASHVEQQISMVSSTFTGFSLYLQAGEQNVNGTVTVSLLDTLGQIMDIWELDSEQISNDGFYRFYIPTQDVEVGEVWSVVIDAESSEGIVAYLKALDLKNITNKNELLHEFSVDEISGQDLDSEERYSLSYEIYNGACGSLKFFFAAVMILIYLCMVVTYIMIVTHKKKEWLFVVAAFIVGGVYMLIIPPYAVPDEASHFVTAYAQSSRLLGEEVYDEEGYVILDADSADYLVRLERPTKSTYTNYIRSLLGKENSIVNHSVSSRKPLNSSHFGYIPQVLGMSVGRILGLNGAWIFNLGALSSLIFYCFIMFWCIRLIPQFGKNLLFVTGVMPMTMQLVASYNYDSTLIGASFFLISYVLYLAYDNRKEKIEIKDYLLLLGAAIVIIPIKVCYIPLLGLGLLIPKEKFGGIKKKIISGGILLTCGIASIMLTRLMQIVNTVSSSSASAATTGTVTLAECLRNPIQTFLIFFRTMEQYASIYFERMIGDAFGYLEITVPHIIVYGFALLLFLSLLQRQSDTHLWKGQTRVWFVVIYVISALLVFLALYLSWTEPGTKVIEGVQGRYFIPILPIGLLAIQNRRIIVVKKIDNFLISSACFLHIATILSIISVVINR